MVSIDYATVYSWIQHDLKGNVKQMTYAFIQTFSICKSISFWIVLTQFASFNHAQEMKMNTRVSNTQQFENDRDSI